MTRTGRLLMTLPASLLVATFVGCGIQQGIEENARQLSQQQAQLEQLRQEVAALRAQAASGATQGGGAPPGGTRSAARCDQAVKSEATRKGGKTFAAGEFTVALGYYQDALTACPTSAQAEVNVARAYEALGERGEAIVHYQAATRLAASAPDDTAGQQAREALGRLGAK